MVTRPRRSYAGDRGAGGQRRLVVYRTWGERNRSQLRTWRPESTLLHEFGWDRCGRDHFVFVWSGVVGVSTQVCSFYIDRTRCYQTILRNRTAVGECGMGRGVAWPNRDQHSRLLLRRTRAMIAAPGRQHVERLAPQWAGNAAPEVLARNWPNGPRGGHAVLAARSASRPDARPPGRALRFHAPPAAARRPAPCCSCGAWRRCSVHTHVRQPQQS